MGVGLETKGERSREKEIDANWLCEDRGRERKKEDWEAGIWFMGQDLEGQAVKSSEIWICIW